MARRWIGLALLVACGTPTVVVQPRPPRPAIAWFANADLVSFEGQDIVAFSLAGDRVTRVGSTTLPADVVGGDWVDRDRLVIELDGRRVVQVTAEGIFPIAVPAREAFARPSPQPEATDLVEGTAGGLIVASDGSAWWSQCTWGWPYDGFQCASHVSARLWPPGGDWLESADQPMAPSEYPWPNAVPAGYHTTASATKLDCDSPAGHVELAANAERSEQVHSFHWVSTSPPRLVIVFGRFGYNDLLPERWALHDGCGENPIEHGDAIAPGPDGLWISTKPRGDDDVKREVRRGAAVIGEFPDGRAYFRPAE